MSRKVKVKTKIKEEFDPKNYTNNGLTEDEVSEIKEAFDLFDTNKTGSIDRDELKNALENLGVDTNNQTLKNMLNEIDENGNDKIEFDEFINMMTAKMSDKDTEADLRKVFQLFVSEGNDTISIDDLKRIARELNEQIKEDELAEMIKRADLDNDSLVNFSEFYQIMTKKI